MNKWLEIDNTWKTFKVYSKTYNNYHFEIYYNNWYRNIILEVNCNNYEFIKLYFDGKYNNIKDCDLRYGIFYLQKIKILNPLKIKEHMEEMKNEVDNFIEKIDSLKAFI